MNLQAYQNEFENIYIVDEDRPGGYIVAEQVDDDLADLFLAAPELLEALKDAVDRMHRAADLLNRDPSPSEIQQAYNAIYAGKQRKAIAKVEGGEQ